MDVDSQKFILKELEIRKKGIVVLIRPDLSYEILHMKFEDALILVRKRGEFMEEASRKNPGKMACVIGMNLETVEGLCKGIGCEIANLNCPGQVVVSGKTTNIELFASLAKNQ